MTQNEKDFALKQSREKLLETVQAIDKLMQTGLDKERIAELQKLKTDLLNTIAKLPPDLPDIRLDEA